MAYNSKEGIAEQLGSYAEFYAVMDERRRRGGYNDEGMRDTESGTLTSFTVLGRYQTDQFGQCWRLNRELFTDADRMTMAPVMSEDEFEMFFDREVRPRITQTFFSMCEGIEGMSLAFPLPPPAIVCARCGGTWTLETCHDIDNAGGFENIDLAPFVGKTLREVDQELTTRTDALRTFGRPLGVQNPKWVEPCADHELATAEERGWRKERSEDNPISWDYVVQTGDRTSVFCYHFYHGPCLWQIKSEVAVVEEMTNLQGMESLFKDIGFDEVVITGTSLPQHLRDWIKSDINEDGDFDKIIDAFTYYRVETKQGSFGIAYAVYPILDLAETGIAFSDFDAEFAAQVPPDFPPIVAFTGEPEQLLRLWQCLVKRMLP